MSAPDALRTSFTGNRRCALRVGMGLAVWLFSLFLLRSPLALAQAILLLAPLVLVPIGLRLLELQVTGKHCRQVLRSVAVAELPAAIALAVAFCFPSGCLAALWTLPWLATTCLLAVAGVTRVGTRPRSADRLCESAALVLIVIGAAWTTLSRGGLQPWGFSDEIVLLTGVHFHFAGFILPLLTALAVRTQQSNAYVWPLTLGIVAGVPLVGVGILCSPVLEVIAALALAAACVFLALVQLRLAARSPGPTVAMLFAVSSLSLLSGMALAAVYAVGEFSGHTWITIQWMIPLHGLANAIGFSACGLLAWWLQSAKLR